MSIQFHVDCRDEKLEGTNSWFSPEEGTCGITLYMDTVRIYLTSEQVDTIIREWRTNESVIKAKLCEHILGYKESSDATS